MRHETSKKLFNYWHNLRGDRAAPERSEIEPSDIRDILGDTFILEIDQRMKTISFRLAGTRICNAYGRELKGLGYLALWDEVDNLKIIQNVSKVYQDQSPIVIGHTGVTSSERVAEFESLLLPLAPSFDNNTRILGTVTPKAAPYWLGSDPLINNRVKSLRTINVEEVSVPTFHTGFTPALVPKDEDLRTLTPGHYDQGGKRIGHLTVFDGGLTENE